MIQINSEEPQPKFKTIFINYDYYFQSQQISNQKYDLQKLNYIIPPGELIRYLSYGVTDLYSIARLFQTSEPYVLYQLMASKIITKKDFDEIISILNEPETPEPTKDEVTKNE